MTTRLLRTKRNDGNKTKKDKGKSLDGIKKKDEMFQGGKYEDIHLQGEKENGKKKGIKKEKRKK